MNAFDLLFLFTHCLSNVEALVWVDFFSSIYIQWNACLRIALASLSLVVVACTVQYCNEAAIERKHFGYNLLH